MNDDNYINLSYIKDQNELAVNLSNLFSINELIYIKLDEVNIKPRDINKIQEIYYEKEFSESKKVFKIIDTMILDNYPAKRYIILRITISNKIQVDFKCKYSKNIIKYIAQTLAKCYNYLLWKNDNDIKIIKSHIMGNILDIVSKFDIDFGELKFILNYLFIQYENDGLLDYNFSISNYDFEVKSNNLDIVRFGFKSNNEWKYVFLQNNNVSISNINFIIDELIGKNNK